MNFETAYKISIDASSIAERSRRAGYEREVKEHLTWIHRTISGRILLDSIKYHDRKVIIRPYAGAGCNAAGGMVINDFLREGFVAYSPATFGKVGPCQKHFVEGGRGMLGDEILFHELFHAFRGISGKFNSRKLGSHLFQYTNSEEFFAVLLTNIYISDGSNRNKSGLRSSHQNHKPLGEDFSRSWDFYARGTEVFGLVKQLREENPGLFVRIGHIENTPFNPLAAYLGDKFKAEERSKSAQTPLGLTKIISEMARSI